MPGVAPAPPRAPPSARRAPHLGHVGLRARGRRAHAVGGAGLLHAGRPELAVHLGAGPGRREVCHRHRGAPLAQEAASVTATPPALDPLHLPLHPFPSPVSQPAGPRPRPPGHCPHLGPATPGLQEHSPVICSQSSRTAPRGSQLQAAGRGRGLRVGQSPRGWETQGNRSGRASGRVARGWGSSLTGAAAPAVGDNAAEVPEAGLAAVTLEAPDPRAAGALAGARVAGAAVGAVGVTLAQACKAGGGTVTPPRAGGSGGRQGAGPGSGTHWGSRPGPRRARP